MDSLASRLRAAAAGRVEWQIVSPDGGICMWFSTSGPDAVLSPEYEARKWLQEHQRDYPERFQGHKVERRLVQTEKDRLMLEAAEALERPLIARPLDDWHEDDGAALWWKLPVDEPPYCGHPNCDNWPGYHTHWTPIVVPGE